MPLDLTAVSSQISSMTARLREGEEERGRRLRHARETISRGGINLEELAHRIDASKTSWLVAGPVEGLDQRHAPPPPPADFTVIATDGSHIDVDRHRSTRCYLINIGAVALSYGSRPSARLESLPRLYSADEDLVIKDPGAALREQVVEGPLLGIKRGIGECRHLAGMAAAMPAGSATLALLDGTLILWPLETEKYPGFIKDELLRRGFLHHLDELQKLNATRRLALAGYISYPRSTDVVNLLRLILCPHDTVNCDRNCTVSRDCDAVAGVRDRELFQTLLAEGERSALFTSRSQIVNDYYGGHRIFFFYLRAGDEIARVEVPEWVAADGALLGLAHALVLDQCRRGHGYPVVLSEAHEQAVVTGADRETFWELVEASLVAEHLPGMTSAKSMSKRTRWL